MQMIKTSFLYILHAHPSQFTNNLKLNFQTEQTYILTQTEGRLQNVSQCNTNA